MSDETTQRVSNKIWVHVTQNKRTPKESFSDVLERLLGLDTKLEPQTQEVEQTPEALI